MFFQSLAFSTEKKPNFVWLFDFQKKLKVFKRSQNLKFWLQKSQIGNPDQQFASSFLLIHTQAFYILHNNTLFVKSTKHNC